MHYKPINIFTIIKIILLLSDVGSFTDTSYLFSY